MLPRRDDNSVAGVPHIALSAAKSLSGWIHPASRTSPPTQYSMFVRSSFIFKRKIETTT
jgi:hypothetical protein